MRLPRVVNTPLRHVPCCSCLNWNCAQLLKISSSVQSRRETDATLILLSFFFLRLAFSGPSVCVSRCALTCHITHACMAPDLSKGAHTFQPRRLQLVHPPSSSSTSLGASHSLTLSLTADPGSGEQCSLHSVTGSFAFSVTFSSPDAQFS